MSLLKHEAIVKSGVVYAALIVIYVILIFAFPHAQPTLQIYHLNSFGEGPVALLTSLPSIIVWIVAFWGYGRLKEYALSIRRTGDGNIFSRLATAAGWLAWGLPISAIVDRWLNGILSYNDHFHGAAVIISNYVVLFFMFTAFFYIGVASRLISKLKPYTVPEGRAGNIIVGGFAIGGILYCYLTLQALHTTSLASHHNPFLLPVWLLILTITIPYLYVWFIGLLSSYQIALYATRTEGIIYRRALGLVVGGLVAVILSSVATQYIGSVVAPTSHVVVDYALLATVLFRAIGGIGFIMMAVGAKKLLRIERI